MHFLEKCIQSTGIAYQKEERNLRQSARSSPNYQYFHFNLNRSKLFMNNCRFDHREIPEDKRTFYGI